MARRMWMGPRGGETWVPTPDSGTSFSPVGWNSKSQFLNGGARVNRSRGTHMEYDLAWNIGTRDALRPITDMYAGKRGPGLIYFIDPMAAEYNVLPESWAFPALACYDSIPLIGDVRPDKIATVTNTLDYPAESARYSLSGTSRSIYIPIPPGYTAWVGVHGSTDGWGGIRVRETVGSTYGVTSFPIFLEVTDPARVSDAHAYSSVCTGIEIDLAASDTNPWPGGSVFPSGDLYPGDLVYPGGDSDSGAPATEIVLSGLMVQIFKSGVTPPGGDFISGQGHSGCDFEAAPTTTAYSAVLAGAEIGVAAKLIEVGDSQ